MQGVFNVVSAVGYVVKMLDAACSFLFSLLGYLPAIIGAAVIVYVAVYAVRFLLLK